MWLLFLFLFETSIHGTPLDKKRGFLIYQEKQKSYDANKKKYFKNYKKKYHAYQKRRQSIVEKHLKSRKNTSNPMLKKEWEKKQQVFDDLRSQNRKKYIKKIKQVRKRNKQNSYQEFIFSGK